MLENGEKGILSKDFGIQGLTVVCSVGFHFVSYIKDDAEETSSLAQMIKKPNTSLFPLGKVLGKEQPSSLVNLDNNNSASAKYCNKTGPMITHTNKRQWNT